VYPSIIFFDEQESVVREALNIIESRAIVTSESFNSPKLTKDYFRLRIGSAEREIFSVAFINAQLKLITCEDISAGTLASAEVHPREIARFALKWNANSVILAHNHPSGHVEPSVADKAITQRIKDALALINIEVLDHLVVSVSDAYSFAEHGLI
jgi:DNA repair protein RadC